MSKPLGFFSIIFTLLLIVCGCSEDKIFTVDEEPENSFQEPEDTVPPQPEDSVPPLPTGTLPVMYINVFTDNDKTDFDNEIIDKDLWHKEYFTVAEYWIDVPDSLTRIDGKFTSIGSCDDPLPLQIKARGNSTRVWFSKKPYKIKLDKKQNLLGMTPGKSKHYALLTHADDGYAYLKNFVMWKLGSIFGLQWNPDQEPVELVINGDYRGIYFLTETIRVEPDRVNITELKDNETNPDLITGGYVVELDNIEADALIKIDELTCVPDFPTRPLWITPQQPEEYSDIQKQYVTEQFEEINRLIGENNDELWNILDVEDAVKYYLVNEVLSNVEAFSGSTYIYKDRNEEKWHFSPLWDAGNAFNGACDGYFYQDERYIHQWIPSIRENEEFNSLLHTKWTEFRQSDMSTLFGEMENYTRGIAIAAKADHSRWKNAPLPVIEPHKVVDNSDTQRGLQNAITKMNQKIAWLDMQFGFQE